MSREFFWAPDIISVKKCYPMALSDGDAEVASGGRTCVVLPKI
jgi:hypothetical protein